MKNVLLFSLVFITLISSSCSDEDSASFEKQYIDLKAIIEKSIKSNEISNPTYAKEVWINEEHETITAQNLDWNKELEVFFLVDLNKRDFLSKYAKDSSSKQLTYSLLPEYEAPVKKLRVTFDSTLNVSEVKAFLSSDNFLYQSQRKLYLRFANNQLTEYKAEGWQELFIGSKKTYRISATKKEG